MAVKKDRIRIGGGSAGAEARLDPGIEMIEKGNLDYIMYDTLSESDLSSLAVERLSRSDKPSAQSALWWDILVENRLKENLPALVRNGVKLIATMGGDDPLKVQDSAIRIARKLGLKKLRIAAVYGDDVLDLAKKINLKSVQTNKGVQEYGDDLISAHAYLPCNAIVEALEEGADIVLAGRVGDAALALAPLMYEFGWANDDWDKKARGIMVGHILECGGQSTGGYFADPPYKVVPDLYKIGFPIAEVYPDGEFIVTKVDGSGGLVSEATVQEQVMYEIHDPENYMEADVISNFKYIKTTEMAPNVVRVTNITGKPQPETLKVSMGVREGYIGSAYVFYAGPGALGRAELAREVLYKRFEYAGIDMKNVLLSLLGVDALYLNAPGVPKPPRDLWEVGVRAAIRSKNMDEIIFVMRESTSSLSNEGPAAVSLKLRQYDIREIMGFHHSFLPRDMAQAKMIIKEV